VKHLRTPEFKPYVIFVKPLIPEKKKNVLKSPVSEEISAPLVSILTLVSIVQCEISAFGPSCSMFLPPPQCLLLLDLSCQIFPNASSCWFISCKVVI